MCGIAGFVTAEPVDPARVEQALALMRRRGPDNQKAEVLELDDWHLGLLHARLSIIDLGEQANQPFRAGPATVIFNGEIYNYRELREELECEGVTFTTESDTEVLLRSYLRWGEDCVQRFEGMWAFAIYDSARRRLLLSRDRFNEKPLYFMETPAGFWFGSEVKFIRALSAERLKPNRRHVCRYLVNGYRSLYKTGETFFEHVRELRGGCNLTLDLAAGYLKRFNKSGRNNR